MIDCIKRGTYVVNRNWFRKDADESKYKWESGNARATLFELLIPYHNTLINVYSWYAYKWAFGKSDIYV